MKYQIRKGCFETNSSSMHSLIITKENENIRMTQEEIREEFYLDSPWSKERNKKYGCEVVDVSDYYNDFGRSPFSVLSSFREKLNYAIAEYCGDNYTISSYVAAENRFDEMFKPLLVRLIGCDVVTYEKDDCRHFIIYSDVEGDFLDEVVEVDYADLVLIGSDEINSIKKEDRIYDSYKNISKDGRPIQEAYFDVPDFGSIDHQSSGMLKRFLNNNNISLEDFLVRKDIVVVIDGDEYCELDNLIDCGLIKKDSIVLRFPWDEPPEINEEDDNEETD